VVTILRTTPTTLHTLPRPRLRKSVNQLRAIAEHEHDAPSSECLRLLQEWEAKVQQIQTLVLKLYPVSAQRDL
jgi:hypothetical protein